MPEKQHTQNGVSKVFHWIIDKLLPWALMVVIATVIGFGVEMLTWRVSVDKDLHYLKKYIEEEEDSIQEAKDMIEALDLELSALNSHLPRSHVNREEFKEHTRQLERRIDKLEASTR